MDVHFTREIELESINRTLHIFQKAIGDVGCVVWDAAIVLSKFLEHSVNSIHLKGKNVIELGAGVGCVGLTAACLGANVVMTDLPEIVPLLENNILSNKCTWLSSGGQVTAKPLEWSCDCTRDAFFKPNFILMADCVYYPESVDDLISTLCILSNDKTEIIISQEERESEKQKMVWNSFLKSFNEKFNYYLVPENEQHPLFHSSDICLMRATKKL